MTSPLKLVSSARPTPDLTAAYLKLAENLRERIIDGTYQAGDRLPSEAKLCQTSGLSLLTVRQALGVLVGEGLLERFPGRGTFVAEINWRKAHFSLGSLVDRVADQDIRVRIVRTEVRRASVEIAARLSLNPGRPVVYLKRTIAAPGEPPFMIQEGHMLLDPRRPIMEAELAGTYLTGLFAGRGQGLIKTARLTISPVGLSEEDATLLSRPPGTVGFRLDYTFYDAAAAPLAAGSFFTVEDALQLQATIGVPLAETGERDS